MQVNERQIACTSECEHRVNLSLNAFVHPCIPLLLSQALALACLGERAPSHSPNQQDMPHFDGLFSPINYRADLM